MVRKPDHGIDFQSALTLFRQPKRASVRRPACYAAFTQRGDPMRLDVHPMTLGMTIVLSCSMFACGGGTISYRHVDTPTAEVHEYGAPKQTEYALEFEPEKEQLGITIYEHSVCDKIRVQVVDRTRETLEGDEVINETPLGKVQIAQKVDGQVPCDQRFAREAQVSLKVGEAVYPIGKTDAEGHVGVNLAKRLDADVYGAPEGEVVVLVRGQGSVASKEVGRVPLGELRARQERVDQLVQELSALLGKPSGAMTPEEITRSYELYAQLRSIAWYDSRFQGLRQRFWEVWQNQRSQEYSENLGRNLEALNKSKELLRTAGPGAIPLFAQVGINSGTVSERTLEWSRFEMLKGLRENPGACQGGFSWTAMPDVLSVQQQIAGGYLHFVYGDPYEKVLSGMCGRWQGIR